ncbi:MAG: PUR family DNA/RNA-binding protein [Bacteroidaceae bacterium]|nr:PUR family DNA/RNA-binding protein [Bacteroidaceae bacterium]
MEDFKRNGEGKEREIVFSRTIKAGKRIYYVDVKRNRKDELYLAVTESKKIVDGTDFANQHISFEKHKIFLYREDFEKFQNGLNEAIAYIESQQGKAEPRIEQDNSEIKIDMDF